MFSVVIPVYNKLPHLERSINSVLCQTFKDFELLLIDDASTDGSLRKIESFSDPRIRIFKRNLPGPGGYAARNLGIKKANNEWIAFLDADDEWYPYHLEKMHELALNYPDAIFLSSGWETSINRVVRKNKFIESSRLNGFTSFNMSEYLNLSMKGQCPVWTSVACINKRIPFSADLFPSEGNIRRGGDTYAWLKIMCYSNRIYCSGHIGGIYYLDSINQVTKKTSGMFNLFDRKHFNLLVANVGHKEVKLIKKFFNMKIIQNWILTLNNPNNKTTLRTKILYKDDRFKAVSFVTISFLPRFVLRLMIKALRYLNVKWP